jgi:hypothetical protein
MARQRLSVQAAAEHLGVSVDAVRSRIRRGTLDSEKGEDGRVFVWLGGDQAPDEPQRQAEGSRELVEALQAQVEDLQRRLDRETEANRENRRLLAAALERIPEIEPPAETRGDDLRAEQEEPSPTSTEGSHEPEAAASRPWWRRWFGP